MVRQDAAPSRALGRWFHFALVLASIVVAPVGAAAQTNLAPNPSFELLSGTAPANWTLCTSSGAATLAAVSTPVDQGSRSLRVALTAAGDVGVCSDAVAIPPGVTLRLAARLDVNIGATKDKQARLQILELSSGDVQLSNRIVATSAGRGSGWEGVSGSFTTGPSTAKVRIRLLHDVPGSGGLTFYWDSVSLVRETAVAWERWERELTSTVDYSAGSNSNPYRDLRITASFYRSSTCSGTPAFQQAAYWDGVPGSASARSFKVRTALPLGDWCWQTSCSNVATAGATTPSCTGDSGLTQSGTIKVTPYTGANKLYRLGLPIPKSGGSFLVYGDNVTTFPWIADTAWSAPVSFSLPALGSPPSADLWKNYVADRAGKGFTVLLVAPAPQYVNAPASPPTPPASGFIGFLAGSTCSPANYRVVPNECTYLDPAYWRKLDSMVKDANDAGLVVMVAGLIDPTDRGGPGTLLTPLQKYPRRDAAEAFARQLAARLAGSFVFFSPGFDDRVDELLEDGQQVKDAMNTVGPALRGPGGASPRHLVGNQLAGGAALTDYDLFHAAPWLNFELYQSGHKGNMGSPCGYDQGQDYAKAVCRARELTLRFRCQGAASTVQACPAGLPPGQFKPSVNSEGAYENFENAQAGDPDTREGERHTAYVSALSGSFGYTIGVQGLYGWDNPGIYSNSFQQNKSQADDDLARLGGLFKGGPWTDLEPRHNLIANNPVVNSATTNPVTTNSPPANERSRMLLAGNSGYALVYVPGIDPHTFAGVRIKTTGVSNALPGLSCKTGWTKLWVSPRSQEKDIKVNCTSGNGFISLGGPLTCPDSSKPCDWVLRLTKAKEGGDPPDLSGHSPMEPRDLEVWTELSSDSLTSSIVAQVSDLGGLALSESFVVSPDGVSFQKLPTIVQDALGNFFISWEAESPTTGLDEIFARRYDGEGKPLGETFAVSNPAESQQAEPSITSDQESNVTVAWTHHGVDDEPGWIELQIYDQAGTPVGDTIGLPPDPGGDPTSALVRADAKGNLWVAWTTEDHSGSAGDVFAQKLLRGGELVGLPRRVNSTRLGVHRLVELKVEGDGSFLVVWEGLAADDQGQGLRERRYDAEGRPLAEETPVGSSD